MVRNLLVPLDGSPFGEHALAAAISLARRSEARLTLMHVHRPLEDTYAEIVLMDRTLDEQMREQEKNYLTAVETRVRQVYSGPVSTVFAEGEIAPAICEETVKQNADLVVMTTHARGAFARFWLGSVTDELVRSETVPLLLVHPKEEPVDLTADVPLQHILVPLDGSHLAEQIFDPVLNLAQATRSNFTLLRVMSPAIPTTIPPEPGAFGDAAHHLMERVETIHAQIRQEALDYLEKAAARVIANGLQVQVQVAVDDQPALAILNAAKPPIDLIALATHGRGGLSRLLLGSVADKIVRGSHVPVLVYRPRH